jgi:P27 family predicted phage terminase small subunit
MWVDVWTYCKDWISPQIDMPLVEQACKQYAEMASYRGLIAKHGAIVEVPIATPSGRIIGTGLDANPAVKMLRDAEKAFHNTMSSLGIPPTDRARLGLVKIKAESKLEQLIRLRAERGVGTMSAPILDVSSEG